MSLLFTVNKGNENMVHQGQHIDRCTACKQLISSLSCQQLCPINPLVCVKEVRRSFFLLLLTLVFAKPPPHIFKRRKSNLIIRNTKSREKAPAARVVSAFPPLLESVSKRLAHCKTGEKFLKYLCSKTAPLQEFPKLLQTVFTIKGQRNSVSRAEKMTDSSLQNVGNGAASNNRESAIVAAINSMSELLVSSITSMKSTMAESLGKMKDTTDQLVIEEGPSGKTMSSYK